MTVTILTGDVRDRLKDIPDNSVQCVVTSPPYFGLRDYGVPGQIGLEPTLAGYIETMVAVFREVKRVLRDDGTLWLNLGDSYAANRSYQVTDNKHRDVGNNGAMRVPDGLKPKDLMMVPARVAIALQDDGWFLRSHIIWHKKAPMPESVTDRPTSAHESIFLLTKSARYYWDAEAVREPMVKGAAGSSFTDGKTGINGMGRVSEIEREDNPDGRNCRNVWTLGPDPFPGAHFAVMPREIPRRCIKAGTKPGDTVLDPFGGAGTVGLVADELGRNAILIELNTEYAEMARQRIHGAAPLFAEVATA